MRVQRVRLWHGFALAGCLFAAPVSADEVLLRGGGRVEGLVVERTGAVVVVETGPGRVTLPASRVLRIVESPSMLVEYLERAAALEPQDADGWADLARWAAARQLETQAKDAWRRVLDADPGHPAANGALGRVRVEGTWMPEDDAWRARGYVPFEGRWVTPAEHEALVRERRAEEAARQEEREADARVREAEARAREAEARAKEAEAAAQQDEGIPLWWGWGGGIVPPVGGWTPDPHPKAHPPGRHTGAPPAAGPRPSPPAVPQPASPPPRAPTRGRGAGVSRPAPTPPQPTQPTPGR